MFEQTPSIRYTASKHYLHRLRCSAIALLLFFLSFAQPLTVSTQPNVPDIKQAVVLMDKAIRYFSVLTGRDIKADDAAWLRDQWCKACYNRAKAPWLWPKRTGRDFWRAKSQSLPNFLKYSWGSARRRTRNEAYCGKSPKSALTKYLRMLQNSYKILYADCKRNVVVTERAAKTLLAEMNFVAWFAGTPVLSQAEEAELLKQWTDYYRSTKDKGSAILAEAGLAVLQQWWSWLEPEKKRKVLADLRKEGIKHAADTQKLLGKYVNRASLEVVVMNAKRQNCQKMAAMLQGDVALFAAEQGPYLPLQTGRLAGLAGQSTLFKHFCLQQGDLQFFNLSGGASESHHQAGSTRH